ncbi:MAG: hypothetical protein WD875_02335 [Pirellulales bacterium]
MPNKGRLLLEYDDRLNRVWLTWCKGTDQQRGPKVTEALGVAAKNGAVLCQLAVGEDYPPASKPGEPPHRRSGEGQRSIRHGSQRSTSQGWVDSASGDFDYMAYHDQHGRPWLLDTLTAHRARLQRDVDAHLGI